MRSLDYSLDTSPRPLGVQSYESDHLDWRSGLSIQVDWTSVKRAHPSRALATTALNNTAISMCVSTYRRSNSQVSIRSYVSS